MLAGLEIKQAFLNYFKQNQHTIVPSSSLVPRNDPTLLFTNAGMVQFKEVFVGQAKRPYNRAATAQKCVRAGGKHNDLENVGRTARHHTFFEMLGNFSFGDYFKEQAIIFAWEFLTQSLRLPVEKLWVTVYQDDDEAAQLWQDKVGVRSERIARFGKKDNFWSMGDVGPCGPCSEIIIDQGPGVGCGKPDCKIGCECDRYLELWNLVFMQYDRLADGKLIPLPKPSIDTGMGLERITAIVQGVHSNYDTDLFAPLINRVGETAQVSYGQSHDSDVSLRVIADHIRATTFLISDGVLPANEGRGYVLRRIIRRALRHGKMLGIHRAFLYEMVDKVVEMMHSAYPELEDRQDYVRRVVRSEEERFSETLEQGMRLLDEAMQQAQGTGSRHLPGAQVFQLYDTYGFPLDLTQEILEDKGFTYDQAGFTEAMQQQRTLARAARKGIAFTYQWEAPYANQLAGKYIKKYGPTQFVGYESLEVGTKVLAIVSSEGFIDEAKQGQIVNVILEATPFYAEKGGQVGDTGRISGAEVSFKVENTKPANDDIIEHYGKVETGTLRVGDEVLASVDKLRRQAICNNHTATHLLQAALRQVLGDQVKQSGSLVAPDRLRFDFTHFTALSDEELTQVQALVNGYIRADYPVKTAVMNLDEAMATGAMALFDEKYGDRVRVVQVDEVSKELCGGTHNQATGEIGLFVVTSESSIASGVRRIEAQTGEEAYNLARRQEQNLKKIAHMLKASPVEAVDRIERLLNELQEKNRQIASLEQQMAKAQLSSLADQARQINGIKVISAQVPTMGQEQLRSLGDMLRGEIGSGVVALGMVVDNKVQFLTMVSKDLIPKLHAGNIVKELAKITGGGGGGRPDMAQAGGNQSDKLPLALEETYKIVEQALKA